MQFKCPECSGFVSIDSADLGKNVACGHCQKIVNSPATPFSKGIKINDFVIEREVGCGGMGNVYLAQQITLDRPIALKILKDKYASDSEFIVQFVREARAAAKLNHSNIVQAYAVGEEDGIFFFAMEFIDGKTMKEILTEERKIAPDRAARIIRDIALALDYAWTESKIVHHDIKPDNIMLTSTGKAKLADLGLAGMFGDNDDSDNDEVFGTPQYISPEQLLGDKTDVRSDIYSLGATFYHFLTGEFVYVGASATEIAHQHVNGTLIPPIDRDKTVPQILSDIICKMMAKDVEQRYQSAEDVALDIQHYLDINNITTTSRIIPPVVMPDTISAPVLKFGGEKEQKTASAAAPEKAPTPIPTPVPLPAAAPVLGLKKEEPKEAPAPKKTAKPDVGSGDKKNTESSKNAGTSDKKNLKHATSAQKVKAVKAKAAAGKPLVAKKHVPGRSLKWLFWAVPLFLVVAGGAGGFVYYLYQNDWTCPIWDNFQEWNSERQKVAAENAALRAINNVVAPTEEQLRKDYVPEINKLKKFIADNPSSGREFLKKVEDFIDKNGKPELENEKKPFAELMDLWHKTDDKVNIIPERAKLAAEHRNDYVRRENEELRKIREQKAEAERKERERKERERKAAAERKAEAERREAVRREEAARRKAEAEQRRKQAASISAFRTKTVNVKRDFARLFLEAAKDSRKYREFTGKVNNFYNDYTPDQYQMTAYNELEKYVLEFNKALPDARKKYLFFLENEKLFCRHMLQLPRLGQVEIVKFNFKDRTFVARNIINDSTRVVSLDDSNVRKRVFDLIMKKSAKKYHEIQYLPFYFELFFGDPAAASRLKKPSGIWAKYFANYR